MTYNELKKQRQAKYDELFKAVGLFWAFGNDQFEKNKTPLEEGNKYCSIGAGGFFPGQHKQAYIDGIDAINEWEKQAKAELKANQAEANAAILYELNNYECFYTDKIDEVINIFKNVYTIEQIHKVYRKNLNKTKTY